MADTSLLYLYLKKKKKKDEKSNTSFRILQGEEVNDGKCYCSF